MSFQNSRGRRGSRAQKPQTSTQEVLVLKSKSLGEADRIVTLVGRERGRFMTVAKGVRKLTSKQKSALESGSIARVYLIERGGGAGNGGWPLVTQASLINDCRMIRDNLVKIRQLMQFLEIVDKLIVEMELEIEVWTKILLIRELIVGAEGSEDKQRNGLVRKKLEELVEELGFKSSEEIRSSGKSVVGYVGEVVGTPMRSWDYLDVNRKAKGQ